MWIFDLGGIWAHEPANWAKRSFGSWFGELKYLIRGNRDIQVLQTVWAA